MLGIAEALEIYNINKENPKLSIAQAFEIWKNSQKKEEKERKEETKENFFDSSDDDDEEASEQIPTPIPPQIPTPGLNLFMSQTQSFN